MNYCVGMTYKKTQKDYSKNLSSHLHGCNKSVCQLLCVATSKAEFASSLLGNELVRRNFVTAWTQGQY